MLSTASPFNANVARAIQPLRTQVLCDLAQIEQVWHEWQALFVRCNAQCLFLLPTWHAAWWRAFKGDSTAHIVTVRDQSHRLIGIAPLQLRKDVWRGLRVRVLGTYNNEHASRSDFLIDPAYLEPAIAAIVQHIARISWKWDVLHLQQVSPKAAWFDGFLNASKVAQLKPFAPTPGIAKCTIDIVGSWQEFLSNKTAHFRGRLRENMRRVAKGGRLDYRRSSGTAADFEIFGELEQSSWKAQDANARLGDAGWRFQREVALATDVGVRCHNLFLEMDGKVVGAIHAVGIGNRMYSMQMLFDESVRHLYPGRALFAVQLADMFADGETQVLDLNGNSAFCQSWTENAEQFVDLQVFSNNPYAWLLTLLKKKWGRHR